MFKMNTLGNLGSDHHAYFSHSPVQRVTNSATIYNRGMATGASFPQPQHQLVLGQKMNSVAHSNYSKPTASFGGQHHLSQHQLSCKTTDSLLNLNNRVGFTPDLKRVATYETQQECVQANLTGRLTCANESDGGTDQEFAIDELTNRHLPDATFAPDAGVATNRSKHTFKSSIDQQQRDLLLLRCRDAIEELHQEIEEERKAKAEIERAAGEAQRLVGEL